MRLSRQTLESSDASKKRRTATLLRSVAKRITALKRDCGLRYNPEKEDPDTPLEPADVFIHGALMSAGGTCASMPVVLVAVGRRLGYPLKLFGARGPKYGHLLTRWDDSRGERLNIEVSGPGWDSHPDEYYRTGFFALTPQEEREGRYLLSMTPREEVADFLVQRAYLLRDAGELGISARTFACACQLSPDNLNHRRALRQTLGLWNRALDHRKPFGFPYVRFTNTVEGTWPALSVECD